MSTHTTSPRFTVTVQPGLATVQAMVMAAAMMACADGHVAKEERRSLIRFLRHHGVLERYGRAECLASFDRAVRDTGRFNLEEACDAADRLHSIAGTASAWLVAHAAAHVALADGITWPQEMALLQVIRDRVGVSAPDPNRSL